VTMSGTDINSKDDITSEINSQDDDPSCISHRTFRSSELKTQMLRRLAETDAHFKHQQRGEPDLTQEEKEQIANEILKKSPSKFLENYSRYLTLDDITYFADMKDNYMIDFYLKEITARCNDANKLVVKNRRYQALQKMMEEGEYFSQNEMKWRDPLLFEQMVGQYETQREKDTREVDMNDLKFSSILFKNMDGIENQELFDKMKENEACQEEEDEESSDEEEKDKSENDKGVDEERDRELEEASDEMSEAEKGHMTGEFLMIMQERFLSGQDQDFDYSAVDLNTEYDALDILGHDIEERYFDEDECDAMSQESPGETTDIASGKGHNSDDMSSKRT